MTREQLVARLRVVEGYLSAARELSLLSPEHTGASPVEQDFVTHDALRMLDRSGTPAFIYELDEGLRVLDANYAFAALTGYFGNDLWALCLTDLLDLRPHPRVFRMLSRARPKGFVETGIWRGRTKSNETRQVIASGHDLVFQGRRARFVVLHSAREQHDPMRLARTLVCALPVAAYLADADGNVDAANSAAAELLGYDAPEALRGMTESRLFDSTAAARHPSTQWTDSPLRRADGGILELQVRSAELDFDGSPHHVVLLREPPPAPPAPEPTAASTPREWRWQQDAVLRFIQIGEESLGAQAGERCWLGHSILELPVRWQSLEDKRRYQHAVGLHQPFQSIELHLPVEGSGESVLLLSGGPLHDEHGNFLGYHGIARDVTARRARDAQLQLLTSLMQHTEDAVLALSTDMGVVGWNPGASRLLGYAREEVIGKRLNVLCADSDGELVDQLTQVARDGEAIVQRPARLRHRDGHEVPVAATCSAVRNATRRVVGLALVLRDARHTQLPVQALTLENTQLRTALSAAQLHIWELDPTQGRMRYGESLPQLLGYDAEELPEYEGPFAGVIEARDAPQVLKALSALQDGRAGQMDAVFRAWRKNGEQIWLHARARMAPEVDVDSPPRVLGTCADVTAAKHQEQSRRVLGALADVAGAVIFSLALDGLVLSWSPGAEAALGYRATEIVGNHHDRLLPEESRAQHEDAMRQLREGIGKVTLTALRRHRDAGVVELDCIMAPIRDAGGSLCEIAFMGQRCAARVAGVTAGAEAVAAPLAAQLPAQLPAPPPDPARGAWHLARIVESCRDAIVSFGPDGNIESFNLGAEKLLGFEREEVIGQHLSRAFDGAFVLTALAALDPAGAAHSLVRHETRLRRRDGEMLDLSLDLFPLIDEGRIVGAACLLHDLSAQRRQESDLRAGDARFRSLVEATHQAVWITTAEGEMAAENPSWLRYTGQSPEEARGLGWLDALHPEDRDHAMLRWKAALASGSVYECPQRVRRADGQWRDMIARAVPVRDAQGTLQEWVGIHVDITDQRNTEDALRESEGRLQSILNSAAEGIVVVDQEGHIERMNIAAQRMFDYAPADYATLDLKQLIVELDREFEGEDAEQRYAAWLRRMIGSQRDLTGQRQDGRRFPLELSVNEVSEAGHGTRFVAIVRDVTERKSWEARIFQLAYSDSLTGLPNRLLLVDRLEQAVAGAQRNRTQVGVLFFDFDGFKQVNDRYGHHTGDLLLKGMSERIRNCVREIDTVSRLGGDEFVVVLPELKDGADAGAVARKIIAALSQPYSIEHQEISITLTAGISVYPGDGESAEVLIRHADTAMYFAKENGKNRFRFFNPDFQALLH